jgi:hypothetical protein
VEQVGGLVHRDVAEERVQCRQPHVPRTRAVAAVPLEVVEEPADEGGVDLFERERAGLFSQALGGEAKQEPEAVAIDWRWCASWRAAARSASR